MSDQVVYLNQEPPQWQLGRPPTGYNGESTGCTDNVGCMIVYHEKNRLITPLAFRRATGRTSATDGRGLTPNDFLRGLLAYRVRGYGYHANVHAEDCIKATDNGIVLVGVGYVGYPTVAQCEIGGKEDVGFKGAHAIGLWGRRYWPEAPEHWEEGKFYPGWRIWTRDPDHHQDHTPTYDRMRSSWLEPAMQAIKRDRWKTTFAIWKG